VILCLIGSQCKQWSNGAEGLQNDAAQTTRTSEFWTRFSRRMFLPVMEGLGLIRLIKVVFSNDANAQPQTSRRRGDGMEHVVLYSSNIVLYIWDNIDGRRRRRVAVQSTVDNGVSHHLHLPCTVAARRIQR